MERREMPMMHQVNLPLFNISLFSIAGASVGIYSNVFRVRRFTGSPDGYSKSILSINDQYPPPTIIVRRGDLINITVINESPEATAIHWHGLKQENSLHMDGVPGITQCEILPNQSYQYLFSSKEQSGTFWYHSHSGMQYGEGLKGVVVIKDPQDPWKDFYDDEDILQLTDWYHHSVNQLLKTYIDPGTLDPVPDTGLINGIGQFNCTRNVNCSYAHVTIRSGERKRFRIVNTCVYARMTLSIDQHRMRLIEADGIALDGTVFVRTLRLTPGQRYSVIVEGKRLNRSADYWIRATIHPFVDYKNEYNMSVQPNISAILHYVSDANENLLQRFPSLASFENDGKRIQQSITDGELFSDEIDLFPMDFVRRQFPVNKGNVRTLIYNSQHHGGNPAAFYMNNETFSHPTNRTLLAQVLLLNASEVSWPTMVRIEENEVLDVIINNIDFAPHPFHLHGHHVWILAQGKSNELYFNQSTFNQIAYNEENPVYRDTFTVNAFSYLAFRFKADNPGVWMMHCHNDWHLQIGMALIFVESAEQVKAFYQTRNFTALIPSQCRTHP